MAQRAPFSSPSFLVSNTQKILRFLPLQVALTATVAAQTPQQQYVFGSVPITTTTSQMAAYAKNGQTGALSAVAGSPFADSLQGGAMAIDGLGRFLFVINTGTSNISMFLIDQSTGSLTAVPVSPFSTGPTENPNMAATSPACLTAEKSGQFLYVGYRFGNFVNQGAINEYLIDAANQQLVPLSAQPTTDIASPPIGMITDPKGLHLYVGLGLNPSKGAWLCGQRFLRLRRHTIGCYLHRSQRATPRRNSRLLRCDCGHDSEPQFPPFIWLEVFALLACCGVVVLFLYASRLQRWSLSPTLLRVAALAVFASLCVFEAAGCASGGASASPQVVPTPRVIGTPQGTSTITLTPTVTTSTGTPLPGTPPIQLTLTVQ